VDLSTGFVTPKVVCFAISVQVEKHIVICSKPEFEVAFGPERLISFDAVLGGVIECGPREKIEGETSEGVDSVGKEVGVLGLRNGMLERLIVDLLHM
jgi:hypothetical protein